MTELSFLIDLLLNHELQKVTKDLIAMRIKDVEAGLTQPTYMVQPGPPIGQRVPYPNGTQAASTLALMAKHGDIPIPPQAQVQPTQVENIGQTPQAAAAMATRNAIINEAIAGKRGDVRSKKW